MDIKVNGHFHDYIFDWNKKFYFAIGGLTFGSL